LKNFTKSIEDDIAMKQIFTAVNKAVIPI